MSFADEPAVETTVMQRQKIGTRSVSLSSVSLINEDEVTEESKEEECAPNFDFRVLRLDLKLGPNGSSSSATSLVSQLEKSSIANLLDDRISASMKHMDKLRVRVEDTSSKVLVTGDLNAGKSTLVNALMRREVMPRRPTALHDGILRGTRCCRERRQGRGAFGEGRIGVCHQGRDDLHSRFHSRSRGHRWGERERSTNNKTLYLRPSFPPRSRC